MTKARNVAKKNAKGTVEVSDKVDNELGDVELDGAEIFDCKNESDGEDVAARIKKEKEEEDD